MPITVTPLQAPTITVDSNIKANSVVVSSDGRTVTKASIATHTAPVTISISGGQGTIRYTLNGKNPTLGSTAYTGPFVLRSNGNGHSSDKTVMKAKSFHQGRSSEITKVEFKLK